MTHTVIIVPGLGDNGDLIRAGTRFWRRHGLAPCIHMVGWNERDGTFEEKLAALSRRVNRLSRRGLVSLVGCSAGASMAFTVFARHRRAIRRAAGICGQLREKTEYDNSAFIRLAEESPLYGRSVSVFETEEGSIAPYDRARMMTISSRFGDQLVPPDASVVEGANNRSIPVYGHRIGIALSLTLFAGPLLKFLKGE